MKDMTVPFDRTTCACPKCVACCKKQPGFLIPGDAERIAAFLGQPVEPFLWASPGAVVKNTDTNRAFSIRTITPRMERGRCVFLGDDDRCQIHPVAPFGCAYHDLHMPRREGEERSRWGLLAVVESEAYRLLRSKLPLAQSWSPNHYR